MPVRTALADALAFALCVTCAGCGEPDVSLCDRCRSDLTPAPVHREAATVPVWSGLAFEGAAARVIRVLKEDGRTSLARALAPALAAAVARCGPSPGTAVVPVPSSRAALRRRGFRPAELIARRAGLAPRRMLVPARRTADQRALGRDERARNVAGSMRARNVGGLEVIVVDDVLTTGATLAEAVRALEDAGARVVGAATAAATPRRFPAHRTHT